MLIHGCPYFLFSLTQPATWFEFLMFPIKIIISFLLIYPSFTDTLQTFKSMWNELMKLQFAGLMNFDKIQTLWLDSACQVLYPVFQLRFCFLYKNWEKKKTTSTLACIRLTSHSIWNQIYWYSTEVILFTQCKTNILTYRWGQIWCS